MIGYLHSEVLDIPIYEYTLSDRICPLQECIAEYPEGYILPGRLRNCMLWDVRNLSYVVLPDQ